LRAVTLYGDCVLLHGSGMIRWLSAVGIPLHGEGGP